MRRSLGRHKVQDSNLAYFINQLENFDPTLHEPLISISWSRDIKLRPGISMANESTSFTRQGFGAPGSLTNAVAPAGGNMPWISKETNAIPNIQVNGEKVVLPLLTLGREVSYTSIELDRSQLTQQPIDVQQMNALNMSYQMNTDQMVYVGSSDVNATGLLNSASITAETVATGAGGSTLWSTKTPVEILADVNTLLKDCWSAAAFAVCPTGLRLPPAQFSYISSQLISSAGNQSILSFLKQNSIALQINGRELDIQPVKWLTGLGQSGNGSDRMMVYTNELNFVRFPMVPIRRETAYYQGIRYAAPYTWAFGEIEFVYPDTLRYADGI
jgi:hypothetical protein